MTVNGLATYTAMQEQQNFNDLVNEHAGLVKRIAYHLMNRLPPNVQSDDLIQAGMLGLLEASRNYDPTQGASFETYAGIRIRGAMLDEIRRSDWTPRSVHRKARMVAEAMREIENEEGRDARDHEVAEALGMSLQEYHQTLQDASGYRMLSMDESHGGTDLTLGDQLSGKTPTPLDGVQTEDFKKSLAEAISGLPERERLVMALYYDEELNLREIGEVLGAGFFRGHPALRSIFC